MDLQAIDTSQPSYMNTKTITRSKSVVLLKHKLLNNNGMEGATTSLLAQLDQQAQTTDPQGTRAI